MKHKKICFAAIVLVTCLFIIYHNYGNGGSEPSKSMIEHPEEIAKLQFNTIRLDRKDYPENKLESLLKSIENLVPEEEVKREEQDFLSILFIYESGEKEVYLFFEEQDQWYMEASDGQVYQDAEFVLDYVDLNAVTVVTLNSLSEEKLKIYIEAWKDQNLSEEERELCTLTESYELDGFSEQEAVNKAKKELDEREKLFAYAKENHSYPSEQKQQELLENYLLDMKASPGYEAYAEICESAGVSVEETVSLRRQSLIELEISNQLWNEKRLGYMRGNDQIGEKTYDDFNEYYRAFLKKYVYEGQGL